MPSAHTDTGGQSEKFSGNPKYHGNPKISANFVLRDLDTCN